MGKTTYKLWRQGLIKRPNVKIWDRHFGINMFMDRGEGLSFFEGLGWVAPALVLSQQYYDGIDREYTFYGTFLNSETTDLQIPTEVAEMLKPEKFSNFEERHSLDITQLAGTEGKYLMYDLFDKNPRAIIHPTGLARIITAQDPETQQVVKRPLFALTDPIVQALEIEFV